MDLEKLVEKLREVILADIKGEFRDFKASVTGELNGFRLAIESMNARLSGIESRLASLESRQDNLENELIHIRRAIDDTNKRIDDTNKRIDETNKRIDALYIEVSEIKGEVKEALSRKEVIEDILVRIERLEAKVA
jgi:peptidoglycan hydrolase CwlO-like protein